MSPYASFDGEADAMVYVPPSRAQPQSAQATSSFNGPFNELSG
jgi:hypothetical protein